MSLLDTFNPRGFPAICENQFLVTTGARLQDVHQVLDHLRRDDRFHPRRIALGGHSAGATTAFQSAYASVLPMLDRPAASGFDAFVMAAPSCFLISRSRRLLGPMLFIGAEKDDWTPVAPCLSELEKTRAEGEPVQMLVLPDTSHTFSTTGVMWNAHVMKFPANAPQLYIRELSYLPRRTRYELPSGEEVGLEDLIQKYAVFLVYRIYGADAGGHWDKAHEVAAATGRFFKALGW